MLAHGRYECFIMHMLYVWVLCASYGSLSSGLLLYSVGSVVNRVQVVLSGFSVRLLCFIQAKTLCRYDSMYYLAALVLVCVDVMVM